LDKITQDKPKIRFLTKLWLGIPNPFKISFLSTIGVVSALVLCFYAYSHIFILSGKTNELEKTKKTLFVENLFLLNQDGEDSILRGRPSRCFSFVPDATKPDCDMKLYFDDENKLIGLFFFWFGDISGNPVDIESDKNHLNRFYIFRTGFEKVISNWPSLKAKSFCPDLEGEEYYETQNNNWHISIIRKISVAEVTQFQKKMWDLEKNKNYQVYIYSVVAKNW
jgi:hypothetical protein